MESTKFGEAEMGSTKKSMKKYARVLGVWKKYQRKVRKKYGQVLGVHFKYKHKVRKKYETKSAKIRSTKKVRNEIGENPKYEKKYEIKLAKIQSTKKVRKKSEVQKKYEKSTKYDESMKKVQKKYETEIRDTSRADNIDHSAGTALSSIL